MTFNELRTEVMDRLNLSSTEASARIGRAINRKYRLLTASNWMQLTRRATVQQTAGIGFSTMTFANAEKVLLVKDRSVTPYRDIAETTIDALRDTQPYAADDSPTQFAVLSHTADSVTIEFNRIAQTAFTLYADVLQVKSDLSGTDEPAFPESFHDVLVEAVLEDELNKLEKPNLAAIANRKQEKIISELRMWVAKSTIDRRSGTKTAAGTAGGGGGSSANGSTSYTQTGLLTFDRDPGAPFAVSAASAVVANLDADMLDGFHETSFAKLADNETIAGNWNFDGAVDFDGAIDASGATSLLLPQAAVPAQTAEGSIVWDTNDDLLTVGTGASRKVMTDLDSAQTLTNKSIAASQLTGTVAAARGLTILTSTSTGTQNDFNPGAMPTVVTFLRLNNASLLTITGFTAGVDGQLLFVSSIGAGNVEFVHQSGSSTATGRLINFATTGNTPLAAGIGTATFQYDGTTQRWRLIAHEQGAFIVPTFAAGNFTASGSMTWTLTSPDVSGFGYYLRGRELTVAFSLDTTTVGGVVSTGLQIGNGAYGGFTALAQQFNGAIAQANDNGAIVAAFTQMNASGTFIRVLKQSLANWSLATNTTSIYGQLIFGVV